MKHQIAFSADTFRSYAKSQLAYTSTQVLLKRIEMTCREELKNGKRQALVSCAPHRRDDVEHVTMVLKEKGFVNELLFAYDEDITYINIRVSWE